MRKIVSALTAVLLVLAFSGLSYAAEGFSVLGEVVSIDPAGKTVVIKTEQGTKTVSYQETTVGIEELKPGTSVEMTCIDLEGKSCAQIIKPLKPIPSRTMTGQVVSIDPGGKAVVIKTAAGEEVSMPVTTERAVMVTPNPEAASTEELLEAKPMALEEVKPGTEVKIDCFDMDGKFCANKITTVSPGSAVTAQVFEGEVVSIDPDNKTVVINTQTGQKTLYYQKVTAGAPLEGIEMGSKVRAYCIDVGGKSCIKDINAE